MAVNYKHIGVVGAGSWGTALAIALARNGHTVSIWGNIEADLNNIDRKRENTQYLPGITLPENLQADYQLSSLLSVADVIVLSIPSHAFSQVVKEIAEHETKPVNYIIATKGLEPGSGEFLFKIAEKTLGHDAQIAIIAGPSFAKEVAMGLPTAVVMAAKNNAFSYFAAELFHSDNFRPYLSDDMIGLSLCSAIKNVLAIACGISDGIGYGVNARSALITRGLVEMVKLGNIFGAKSETFYGLAGMGDLILTCTDDQSRNRRFGLALGRGASMADAKKSIGQVVEGAQNSELVHGLAQKHHIELPITEQIYKLTHGQTTAKEAVDALFARPIRAE